MGTGKFIFCLKVLSFDEICVIHIKSCFAKGITIKVLRFDSMDITCIPRNLSKIVLLFDGFKLIIDWFGDVPTYFQFYPVYPGTT